MPALVDLAHRTVVVSLVGAGVWGLWLTGAVWKSRREDRLIHAALAKSSLEKPLDDQSNQQFPITNDPAHESQRRV
ncbi:hypothetical protein IE53DRAFT_385557 [Violaceomyces palustris]|uniref:Uncharacterized protein n=1 Tax=Violaceomyces palustris TaxID=1673888 RepID=A0ACD0P1T3_9BASI|nr:hypothetical protein IE53DRAFT_385557 [Violaceomyces palustris]